MSRSAARLQRSQRVYGSARVSFVDDLELGHFPTLPEEVLARMDEGDYAYRRLSTEEIGLLAQLVDRGIGEGGLGVGFGVTYTPGADYVGSDT